MAIVTKGKAWWIPKDGDRHREDLSKPKTRRELLIALNDPDIQNIYRRHTAVWIVVIENQHVPTEISMLKDTTFEEWRAVIGKVKIKINEMKATL